MIDQIAQGRRDFDAISSLAGRLAALDRKVDDEDRQRIGETAPGQTLTALVQSLLESISPDIINAEITRRHGDPETATEAEINAVEES